MNHEPDTGASHEAIGGDKGAEITFPAAQAVEAADDDGQGTVPPEQGDATPDSARRLAVIPDETETTTAANNPIAIQALRLARTAARDGGGPAAIQALRLARAAARDGGGPVAIQALRLARAAARASAVVPADKPVPAKISPAAFDTWPELGAPGEMLTSLRNNRQRRFFARLALFVGLPTLLMGLYVFLWAAPRYVSEFEITYQTYQNTQSLSSGLVQSILGGNSGGVDLGSLLYEYSRYAELLQKLDDKLHLREYYSSDRIDYPGRLKRNASKEQFLSYYRNHIVDVSQGLGGYLTVDVHAFDSEFSQTLAKAIVQGCDEMVDQMTARARRDGMKFAEEEVARQEDRVRNAQIAQTRFQNVHGDLNPTNTANQFGQIVGGLQSQLSQTRTALTNTLSYASPNAPQVLQLKNQIAALEAQLKDQQKRLTGGDDTYSLILEEYSRLQLENQFAQNAYQSAQQGLAVARADAARKQSYLVDFVTPSRPDGPTQSFYTTYIAAAFLGSLFVYGIGSLVAGAFRDQAGL